MIDCRPLPPFAAADLDAVRAAFRAATPIALGQAWRDAAESGFAPGTVRTGWRDDALLVFAELSDADVFTRATRHNERFWELGDTFEIFLQPEPGREYVEFHVTPNNLRLQLRFATPPSPRPGASGDPFEVSLIRADAFRSRTWVNADAREWCVLAEIPAGAVVLPPAGSSGPTAAPLAGAIWRFSFSRYDCTRGREQPVISSSSPHAEPQFHRPHEWGELRFTGSAGSAGSMNGGRIRP
jgi:hypothetical protein